MEVVDENLIKRERVKRTIILASFLFFIAVSVFFIQMNYLINYYQDKAYPGQFIENQNINGLTKNEIEKMIDKLEINYIDNNLTVNAKNKTFNDEINIIDLKVSNKHIVSEQAMNFYKDKNYITKALFLYKNLLFKNNICTKTYDLEFEYNENKLKEYIKNIKNSVDIEKKEPTLDMQEYGKIIVIDGIKGSNLNIDKTILEFEKNINKIKADSLEIDAVIDIEELKIDKSIFENIDTKISSYTTTYETGSGRGSNVELGASRINKTVILPNEEFSLNKIVLQRTRENGYKAAPEYRNGKIVQGIGGGICQVSTTMYGAQLRAGILPNERHPHSMTVGYAPIGLDAAVFGNILDLKFINPYKYPIYINSYTNQGKITIEFWSNKNLTNGVRYEPKSYKRTSLSADAYLYGYDSENNEVYKKYLGQSNYRPHPKKEDSSEN